MPVTASGAGRGVAGGAAAACRVLPGSAAAAATRCVAAKRRVLASPAAARLPAPTHVQRLHVRCQAASETAPAASSSKKASHAVVIGAGLAGLTAAKALAAHFQTVTVLERDEWTANVAEGSDRRPGVPQFQQPHVLLARGLQALDSLLGDFRGALRDNDFTVFDYGQRFTKEDTDVTGVLATRALVEQTARSMLLSQEPGVSLRSGARVAGLALEEAGAGGKRVADAGRAAGRGVRLKDGTTLPAELVVDASGRSSHSADWLAEAGLQRPPTLEVDAKLGYATPLYERPANYKGPLAALVGGRPWYSRGAVLIPVEGNRWQLILGGYAGGQGCEAAHYHLPLPGHPQPAPAVDMPPGFIVMGDACVAFNPIYGQGITVGVMEAEALQQLLDERVAAAGSTAAALAGVPAARGGHRGDAWTLAVSEDSKWEVAEANYAVPQTAQLFRPYFGAVAVAASQDKKVLVEYVKVMHMLRPPTAFFSPRMLLGALWYGLLEPWLARLPLVGRWYQPQVQAS
ncbi:hypothetical protein ABPG75_009557 [Micractinium tetrahymenae]